MELGNLTVIGTSHIARESVQEIKAFIDENKPDIVAIELDQGRFISLMSPTKQKIDLFSVSKIGVNGMIFLLLGQWAQKTLGRLVGVNPGAEMLAAIKAARKHNLAIALIDQDIQVTLRKFSKSIPLKERLRVLGDIISGLLFKGKNLKGMGLDKLDLNKVPEDKMVTILIGMVRERYPMIYRVLVEERNEIMASNLLGIMQANPDKKVLAVVGAGHEKEILSLVRLYRQHQAELAANAG